MTWVSDFFGWRDPPVKPEKCDRCERKPDQYLWTKGRAMVWEVQKLDLDMGHKAIYRRIISVHGFFDPRDPPVKSKKGGRGERRPDQSLWRKGDAMAQKERKDQFAPLRHKRRYAANEVILRKALAVYGGIIPEGVGIFSALPDGNLTTNDTTGSKKSKTAEELEAEKYSTLSGLKSNELPQALANHVATLALYGLLSSKPATLGSEASRNPFGSGASSLFSAPSTKIERIVSPEDVAAAIAAAISGELQLDQWWDDFKETNSESGVEDENRAEKEENKEDPVVAKVRSSGDLNRHEKRLLGCVIDTSELPRICTSRRP
jgi:hypothetical protein